LFEGKEFFGLNLVGSFYSIKSSIGLKTVLGGFGWQAQLW